MLLITRNRQYASVQTYFRGDIETISKACIVNQPSSTKATFENIENLVISQMLGQILGRDACPILVKPRTSMAVTISDTTSSVSSTYLELDNR